MQDIDDEEATGRYIKKPTKTLQNWRSLRQGPPYIKCGASVRYRKVDIDAWLSEQTVRPER